MTETRPEPTRIVTFLIRWLPVAGFPFLIKAAHGTAAFAALVIPSATVG